jgi:hypothetical protein
MRSSPSLTLCAQTNNIESAQRVFIQVIMDQLVIGEL